MKVPHLHHDRDVCIVGLGYVGLTLAVALAEVGFNVYGVERDPHIVSCVNSGRAHFEENGLDQRLAVQVERGALSASQDWPGATKPRVYVITVGTPLNNEGKTNLDAISSVSRSLQANLQGGELIVLRSTVRVGVSREVVKPILDQAGLKYDLAFCPERTLEGRALLELRTLPQIVGGFDENATIRAAQLFNFLTPTTIRVRTLETAEMIKLINNTQRDLMFAFANEVAQMCDAVGVSANEVISAGNMGYSRASMPRPGPVGGPCLEKDPHILAEGVRLKGGRIQLPIIGRLINEKLPRDTAERISAILGSRPISNVAIAGLAFKGRPETSDLRGTLAVPLILAIRELFTTVNVKGFDPAVDRHATEGMGIQWAETVEDAFRDTDLVIFQNNNKQFEKISFRAASRLMARNGLIYDLWSQFDPETIELENGVTYIGFGNASLRHEPSPAVFTPA